MSSTIAFPISGSVAAGLQPGSHGSLVDLGVSLCPCFVWDEGSALTNDVFNGVGEGVLVTCVGIREFRVVLREKNAFDIN